MSVLYRSYTVLMTLEVRMSLFDFLSGLLAVWGVSFQVELFAFAGQSFIK